MAFTAAEIQTLGFVTIDNYLKNKPIEQIAYDKPWLKKLMAKKKPTVAGKQYIVEQVKKGYGSNIQAVKGDTTVTYNKRDNVRQASYGWTGYHAGLQINEDMLASNGIIVTDDQKQAKSATKSEVVQLTNLLKDQMSDLHEGFNEDLDLRLLRDGTASADDIVGLDALVSRTPAVGTVGGIDAAANTYWRNLAKASLASATIIEEMEKTYRDVLRFNGKPDFIMAGGKAIDVFRAGAKAEESRYVVLGAGGEAASLDPSITNLQFHGIPVLYNPSFDQNDDLLTPAAADEWSKRIYMLSCKNICLRPIEGHDGIARNPARESGNYIHRWAHTWKGALTMNKRNAHAVFTIS